MTEDNKLTILTTSDKIISDERVREIELYKLECLKLIDSAKPAIQRVIEANILYEFVKAK